MNDAEVFTSHREFNNKFPSKLFICSNCGKMTPDPYTCINCSWRADGLFKTMNKGYRYIIEDENKNVQEIFQPIELKKGEQNNV